MYENRPENDEVELDLLKLAQVLVKKAKFIIAITLLVAIAAFGVTYYLITPQYTATAMMYVNNSRVSVGSTTVSISSADLTAAQSLVDTYIVILKSRTTLEQIIDEDDLKYSYEELYDMIESGAVNSTEIFNINVTSTDPQEAEKIANTIAQVLPERIASIVDGSEVRIVDYAVVPSERTSPSYTLNTVIGALVGFLLAAIIVILRYLFDDQIHGEDYLTQTYPGVPLLAVVPDMLTSESKGYYSYPGPGGQRNGRSGESKKREPNKGRELPQRAQQPVKRQQPAARPQAPARAETPARPQSAAQPRAAQPQREQSQPQQKN